MPDCGVCLRECRDKGQLSCQHALCKACSDSNKTCLVCTQRGNGRHRLGKRPSSSAPSATWPHDDTAFEKNGIKLSSPSGSTSNVPVLTKTASHTNGMGLNERFVAGGKPTPLQCNTPGSPQDKSSSGGDFDGDGGSGSGSGINDDDTGNAELNNATAPVESIVSKPSQLDTQTNHLSPSDMVTTKNITTTNSVIRSGEGLVTVQAPTAFDEVRCELRPELSAPKLVRPALRASGKVSVAVLRKFLHTRLNLSPNQAVLFRCAGEDLVDAMTLGQLGTHVWPKSAGHIVLEYRVTQTAS